jgi:hypothetical protein
MTRVAPRAHSMTHEKCARDGLNLPLLLYSRGLSWGVASGIKRRKTIEG